MNFIPNENTNFIFKFSEFECNVWFDFTFIDYSIACMDTQSL